MYGDEIGEKEYYFSLAWLRILGGEILTSFYTKWNNPGNFKHPCDRIKAYAYVCNILTEN